MIRGAFAGSRMRWWIAAGLVALLAVLGGCATLDVKQREWIFRPNKEVWRSPADYNLAFEDVWLDAGEGGERGKIHGWWIPGEPGQPALLYLHGSRWNISSNLFRIVRLRQMGYSVLAIDYRGFGRSDGELPSEQQAYEDALAAFAELARREPDPAKRVVYGHSLGGAVAIDLALKRPDALALVVESSFTSIREMVSTMKYGFLPVAPVLTQHFDSLSKVADLRVPVMFVHGAADRWVPAWMSEKLHAAAPEPKRLLLVEGGSHSNVTWVGFDMLQKNLHEFLAQARASRPAPLASNRTRVDQN